MKIAIIINSTRITNELRDELSEPGLALKYNLTYDFFITEPSEIPALIQSLNLQAYNAIIIGGGDGTVRTAITYLRGLSIPLAILPLGTFNLFAKSLDYPNNLGDLFTLIKNNKTKQVDIAEVNGHTIINHAWIGFYYHLLKLRNKHKNFLGASKVLKIIFNTLNFFKVLPIYTLDFKSENQTKRYKTLLVFIGNNETSTSIFEFGEHKYLSTGLLSINVLNCTNRLQLFLCLISILFKTFKNTKNVTTFETDNLVISTKKDMINLVIDGELFKLHTPLNFTIHQKQLKVITT